MLYPTAHHRILWPSLQGYRIFIETFSRRLMPGRQRVGPLLCGRCFRGWANRWSSRSLPTMVLGSSSKSRAEIISVFKSWEVHASLWTVSCTGPGTNSLSMLWGGLQLVSVSTSGGPPDRHLLQVVLVCVSVSACLPLPA